MTHSHPAPTRLLSHSPLAGISLLILISTLFFHLSTKCHAAIIQRLDGTHITSSVRIDGDLHIDQLIDNSVDLEPMNQFSNDLSSCEGEHRLHWIGNMTTPDVQLKAAFSSALLVNGEIIVNSAFTSFYRVNLDTLVLEPFSDPIPFNEDREHATYFMPHDDSASFYVAGGWNKDIYYNSTWRFDIRTMDWTFMTYHPFEAIYSVGRCSETRCFLFGGTRPLHSSIMIQNILFEFDYRTNTWIDRTTSESPRKVYHGFEYLPHLDALVTFGGSTWDTESDSNAASDSVHIYHLNSSQWTSYSNPVYVNQENAGTIASLFPASIVYHDTIYIATMKLSRASHFMKLLVFPDAAPELHFIPFEGDYVIEQERLQATLPILLHNHLLFTGGTFEEEGETKDFTDVLLLSLC